MQFVAPEAEAKLPGLHELHGELLPIAAEEVPDKQEVQDDPVPNIVSYVPAGHSLHPADVPVGEYEPIEQGDTTQATDPTDKATYRYRSIKRMFIDE